MNAKNLEMITELRRKLHANAELSWREERTKRLLMDFIEDNTSMAVVDCGQWFYASRYIEGTDAIAFRADMDALPIPETIDIPHASLTDGVSHKCGHDGHCAALCGLALELEGMELHRSVYLIFQPAEEIGRGGVMCAGALKERNVTEVYAFHNRSGFPEGSIVVKDGLCQCASKGLAVRMTGLKSHASEPENGISPAFPIAELAVMIREMLSRPRSSLLLCTIVNISVGTRDFGISPADGEICMTIRSDSEDEMEEFEREVRSRASELAEAGGLKVEFEVSDPFPATVSSPECAGRIRAAAKELGRETVEMETWRASEDFGWYTKQCPGAIFYVGNGVDYPALHTLEYDFNDRVLEAAVDVFLKLSGHSAP